MLFGAEQAPFVVGADESRALRVGLVLQDPCRATDAPAASAELDSVFTKT